MDATANFPYEWSPLRVFVVWHPAFAEGKGLADSLYAWFGGSDRELHRNGLGVPVHPWTTLDPDLVPPPPPRATQDITVVIPLIDAEFAGRSAWRQWVDNLFASQDSSTPSRLVLLPWAVHTAAIHIGPVSRSQLAGSGPCEPPTLNRLATDACALELLKEAGPPASRDPSAPLGELHIFISYARRDGRAIALEVRRILQDFGHIRAFLDELDISPGHDWHARLTRALDSGAAMVAVVTDTYASRPWCREELRTFREPRPTESPDRWRVCLYPGQPRRTVHPVHVRGGQRPCGPLGPRARWRSSGSVDARDPDGGPTTGAVPTHRGRAGFRLSRRQLGPRYLDDPYPEPTGARAEGGCLPRRRTADCRDAASQRCLSVHPLHQLRGSTAPTGRPTRPGQGGRGRAAHHTRSSPSRSAIPPRRN